jgi:hypothetical protein
MASPVASAAAAGARLLPAPAAPRRGAAAARRRPPLPPAADKRGGGDDEKAGGGFGEELLDFMYAGKKLRKWYGEEGMVLPKDGGPPRGGGDDDAERDAAARDPAAPRDAVFVLEPDAAPMAEQVLLQLILLRAGVRGLVKDPAAARAGFGEYASFAGGAATDGALLRRELARATALVLCGRAPAAALEAAAAARVPHVVLLSAVGAPPPPGLRLWPFGGGELAALRDEAREAAVRASGLPYTIVRVAELSDAPGGGGAPALRAGGAGGAVAREDAAEVVARAALRDAARGSLVCAVGPPGEGGDVDWAAAFDSLVAAAAPAR